MNARAPHAGAANFTGFTDPAGEPPPLEVVHHADPRTDDVGAGQADLDGPARLLAQKVVAVGHDRPDPAQRGHRSGPGARAPADQVRSEALDALVEDLEVPLAPPLAVADHVDPGGLL